MEILYGAIVWQRGMALPRREELERNSSIQDKLGTQLLFTVACKRILVGICAAKGDQDNCSSFCH